MPKSTFMRAHFPPHITGTRPAPPAPTLCPSSSGPSALTAPAMPASPLQDTDSPPARSPTRPAIVEGTATSPPEGSGAAGSPLQKGASPPTGSSAGEAASPSVSHPHTPSSTQAVFVDFYLGLTDLRSNAIYISNRRWNVRSLVLCRRGEGGGGSGSQQEEETTTKMELHHDVALLAARACISYAFCPAMASSLSREFDENILASTDWGTNPPPQDVVPPVVPKVRYPSRKRSFY